MTKPPLSTKDPTQKKKKKERTHIINSQVVNHQAPNFQRMPERREQMMFGQPTKKSRKNVINLLLNFKTNSKVFIHPNLKKKKFTTPLQHSQNNFPKPTHNQKFQISLAIQMKPHLGLKGYA